MTKLGRPHSTQDLYGTELDQASIPRRERVPACQQGENGFAGTDKIRSLIPNRKHGCDLPYEQEDKECWKDHIA
jgi:hypothetical protein